MRSTAASEAKGGNGYSLVVDSGLLFGNDPYRYPDNLPIVAAKGGPGGKPGCGSLPDVRNNYPVRALVDNTGWGTGLDIRPNPGIGHPWFANYFPATRAVPESRTSSASARRPSDQSRTRGHRPTARRSTGPTGHRLYPPAAPATPRAGARTRRRRHPTRPRRTDRNGA